MYIVNHFPRQQLSYSFKLKEFGVYNFRIDEMAESSPKG